jgi:hypothetical protein
MCGSSCVRRSRAATAIARGRERRARDWPAATHIGGGARLRYTSCRMNRFARRCLANSVFLGLLLAALTLRALIPVGFMPVAGSGRLLSMQLCTSSGYQSVLVRFGQDGRPAPPAPSHDVPCLYSVCSALAPPPSLAAASVPACVVAELTALVVQRVAVPSIARAQAPRGPPILV